MSEKYEYAEHLLSGYFDQDWDLYGSTDEQVVSLFKREFNVKNQQKVISDLRLLSKLNKDDLEELLDYFSDYYYQEDGLTAHQWIQRLIHLMSRSD